MLSSQVWPTTSVTSTRQYAKPLEPYLGRLFKCQGQPAPSCATWEIQDDSRKVKFLNINIGMRVPMVERPKKRYKRIGFPVRNRGGMRTCRCDSKLHNAPKVSGAWVRPTKTLLSRTGQLIIPICHSNFSNVHIETSTALGPYRSPLEGKEGTREPKGPRSVHQSNSHSLTQAVSIRL